MITFEYLPYILILISAGTAALISAILKKDVNERNSQLRYIIGEDLLRTFLGFMVGIFSYYFTQTPLLSAPIAGLVSLIGEPIIKLLLVGGVGALQKVAGVIVNADTVKLINTCVESDHKKKEEPIEKETTEKEDIDDKTKDDDNNIETYNE